METSIQKSYFAVLVFMSWKATIVCKIVTQTLAKETRNTTLKFSNEKFDVLAENTASAHVKKRWACPRKKVYKLSPAAKCRVQSVCYSNCSTVGNDRSIQVQELLHLEGIPFYGLVQIITPSGRFIHRRLTLCDITHRNHHRRTQ